MEGWVDLSTVVKVHSSCPRLYIAAAVAINSLSLIMLAVYILMTCICSYLECSFSVPQVKGVRKILQYSLKSKENKWVGSEQSWRKEGTVRHRQSKEASILWSHNEETRELPGERDNARNNARCTQARKAMHGLDGQHQDKDRTLRRRVSQNDRDKWRKYVHGVANSWIEDGWRAEQNM